MGTTHKIVAIHQINYIPWIGYFHKIASSDVFVMLDNAQYVKETVANRNKIKTKEGREALLSVSVMVSKGRLQNYNEIEVDYSSKWNSKHINILKDSYAKAPFFIPCFEEIESILKTRFETLADLNTAIIKWAVAKLGIHTELKLASQLGQEFGSRNERIINICKYLNADVYLSGTGASKYNNVPLFIENGLELVYQKFSHPTYPQISGPFIPYLSVLDLFFNCGDQSVSYIFNRN